MLVHNEPITLVLTYGAVVTISKIVTGIALFSGAAYVLPKVFAFLKGGAESDKKGDKSKDDDNDGEREEDNKPTNIDKLDENKIKHIVEGSKKKNHKWEKISPRKDWKEIKKIIKEVLKTGGDEIYKEQGMSKIKEIKGVIVEVTYILDEGIRKIGSAWVR